MTIDDVSGTPTSSKTTIAELEAILTVANMTDGTASGTGNLARVNSPTFVTPALGTPASGTLTNCSGTASSLTAGAVTNATFTTALTVNTGTLTLTANADNTSVLTVGSGAVSVSGSNTGDQTAADLGLGTADTPQFAGIELGHATDTTLARVSAGVVSIEGSNIITASDNVSALSDTTSGAIGIGTIELGHATDTTLARVSAGVVSIEGVNIVTTSSTDTLTNKRVEPRVSTEVSSATPTINTDNVDAHSITALAAAITSMTSNLSGTPTNFQRLTIRILDDGTARAITWGASFEDAGYPLPTTTIVSKLLTVGLIYNTVTSKWGCVSVANES